MSSDKLRLGQIILWTKEPLALLMKPADAGSLWKVGLFVEKNINNNCVIMNIEGKLIKCHRAMIMPCPVMDLTL